MILHDRRTLCLAQNKEGNTYFSISSSSCWIFLYMTLHTTLHIIDERNFVYSSILSIWQAVDSLHQVTLQQIWNLIINFLLKEKRAVSIFRGKTKYTGNSFLICPQISVHDINPACHKHLRIICDNFH